MASGCSRLLCACTEREEPAGPSSCDTRPHGDRDRRGRSRGHGGGRTVAASRSPHRGCFGSRGDGRAREHLPGVPCSTLEAATMSSSSSACPAISSPRPRTSSLAASDRGRNLGRAPVEGHAAVGARRGARCRRPTARDASAAAVPRRRTGDRTSRVHVAVGADDDEGLFVVERLAEDLGSRPFRLPEEHRAIYHAAAVFASNYLVSATRVAEQRSSSPQVCRPIGRWCRSSRPPSRTWHEPGPGCAHRARGARRRRHDRPQPRGAGRDRSVGRRRIRRDGAGRARPGGAERAPRRARRAEVEEALRPWI